MCDTKNIDTELWIEKHRPKQLDDIYTNNNILSLLKSFIKIKNIPHIIIYGASGNGKTSLIMSIINNIFGSECKDKMIEFNASDERGIGMIRNKIKYFSKQKTSIKNNIPEWKLIVLDEADTMTTDSQFALRRIIEQHSKITKFCIICNNLNKIIDPIISRCFIINMATIEKDTFINNMKKIITIENIKFNVKILEDIYNITKNDMRQAINILQLYSLADNKYKKDILKDLSGQISKKLLNTIVINIVNKDIKNINSIIKYLYNNGFALVKQIEIFLECYINLDIDDIKKYKLILKLCEIEQNLLKNCNEYIQYINLFYYMLIIV